MGAFILLAIIFILMCLIELNIANFNGLADEKYIAKLLTNLDRDYYLVLNDLRIPNKAGSPIQIDHILISYKGIFVIESNIHIGRIKGSESSPSWKREINKKEVEFYNPVRLNSKNMNALRAYLGELSIGVPFYSVIVFGKQASFELQGPFQTAKVVKINQLLKMLNNVSGSDFLTDSHRVSIKKRLSIISAKEKKSFFEKKKDTIQVESLQPTKRKKEVLSSCPKCSSKLITKIERQGISRQCSRYPICTYISYDFHYKENVKRK